MKEKLRRTIAIFVFAALFLLVNLHNTSQHAPQNTSQNTVSTPAGSVNALSALDKITVKGRAPKTGYARTQFLSDWSEVGSCDMRDLILRRDMTDTFIDPGNHCFVVRGKLNDPYTGKVIDFQRGKQTSAKVQIDHVVALSDAWQTGAQGLSSSDRNKLANDPLNLLAVDGKTNENKSDGDAATWLPPNKAYRCRYVARQLAVKLKYHLWMTPAEKDAIGNLLKKCPDQVLPIESGA